jgi:hypothetical protein
MDGDLQATTFIARASAGSTRTIDLSFLLPGQDTSVSVLPAARLQPVKWSWDGQTFDDRVPYTLDLSRIGVGPEAPRAGWLVSGLVLFGFGAALAGDAWGRPGARQAKVDAHLGWWLLVVGVAMMTVQMAIFVTAA